MFPAIVTSMLDNHFPDFELGKKYPDVDKFDCEIDEELFPDEDNMSVASSLDLGGSVNISGIISDLAFGNSDAESPFAAQVPYAQEPDAQAPPDAQEPLSDDPPEYAALLEEHGGAEALLDQIRQKKILSPQSVYATLLMYPEVYTPVMLTRSNASMVLKTPPGTERRQTKAAIRDLHTMMELHPYISTVLSVVTHHPQWSKVKDMQLMWGKDTDDNDAFRAYIKKSAATVREMQGASFLAKHTKSSLTWAHHSHLKGSDERPRLIDLLFGALSDVRQCARENDLLAPSKKRNRED